jgi:hypothetical protein
MRVATGGVMTDSFAVQDGRRIRTRKPPVSRSKERVLGANSFGDGTVRPQQRSPRKDGWTAARRAKFLEILSVTSNVSEAVEAVGMSQTGVYALKNRDAGFARAWMEALEQAYCELELHILRQAMLGTERVETTETADGAVRTKTVKSYPLAVGLRLLLAHRASVSAFRASQGIERPGSEAIKAEIQARLAAMRIRNSREVAAEEGAARRGGA